MSDLTKRTYEAMLGEIFESLVISIEGELAKSKSFRKSGKNVSEVARSVKHHLLTALSQHLSDPRRSVKVSLNSNHYTKSYCYNPGNFSYNTHKLRAFDYLIDTGFIQIDRKGYLNRELRISGITLYRITEKGLAWFEDALKNKLKLNSLDGLLVTKDFLPLISEIRITQPKEEKIFSDHSSRKIIPFKHSAITEHLRKDVQSINRVLANSWIDLDLQSLDEWDEFYDALNNRKDKSQHKNINFTNRQLYRIFHDKEFSTGGRFYGGWWQQIPSKYRSFLIVNGKPTVEFDYSGLHPAILYAKKGLELPSDPYSSILGKDHRNLAKRCFSALLNSVGPMNGPPNETKISHTGKRWSEIKARIYDLHGPISEYFEKGSGLELMHEDSEIALVIMKHFAQQNIPVYPVHDSFIMHSGYESELLRVMQKAFRDRYGIKCNIKPHVGFRRKPNFDCTPTTGDIDQLLAFSSLPQWKRTDAHFDLKQRHQR